MSRLLHSLPRAAGGRKMDSIVREVVSRSGVQPRLPESPTQTMGVGEESAREAADELRSVVQGADMVFITCGLGGGTGTGGAPVLAQLSKEAGALTIAICTFPFRAEGAIRAENAEYGLEKLRNFADTVVVIPNDKLLELVPRLALNAAFKVADDVLMRAIKGITEIITKPGLVNLDFNDIKTIMKGGGVAMIGLGESDRDNRSEEAIEEAINSPLIDVDISAATGALVNVTGGDRLSGGRGGEGAPAHAGRVLEGRADHRPRHRRDRRPGLRDLPDHAIRSRRLPRDLRVPGAVNDGTPGRFLEARGEGGAEARAARGRPLRRQAGPERGESVPHRRSDERIPGRRHEHGDRG